MNVTLAMVLILAAGVGQNGETPKRRNAEIKTLKAEISDLKAQIAELEKENERLNAKGVEAFEAGFHHAAALLREYFEAFYEVLSKDGGTYYAARFVEGHMIAIEEWSAGQRTERATLMEPARKAMKKIVRDHGGDDKKEQGHVDYMRRKFPPVEKSPVVLVAELKEQDRAKLALRLTEYHGEWVTWRGKVVETVDHIKADYHIALVADGVLVQVRIAPWALGYLRGVAVGKTVVVRGTIADVSGNEWVGAMVFLGNGAAAVDQTGFGDPPKPPQAKKRRR